MSELSTKARARRLGLLGVGLAGSLAAQVARAETFVWNAPPGCPSHDEVERHLARIAQHGTSGAARIAVDVEGPPWRATIRFVDGRERGTRRLEAATCEELAEAAALVMAVAIDREEAPPAPVPPPAPDALAKPASAPAAPPPAPVSRPAAASGDAPTPAAKPSDDGAPHLDVGLALAAQSGLLPSLAGGGALSATLHVGKIELTGTGALFAESTTSTNDAGGRSVTAAFRAWTIDARIGRSFWPTASLRFAPALGIGLSRLSGAGAGASTNTTAEDWLPTPFVGGEASLRLGERIAPFLGIDAGLPLGRSAFAFRGLASPVHEPAEVVVRAAAGVRFDVF